MTELSIAHRPEAGRFEAWVGQQHCELVYTLIDGVMRIHHTGVPRALEGRGLAAQLVAAAMAHARAQGLKVLPLCSYVRAWARRHPECGDVLVR